MQSYLIFALNNLQANRNRMQLTTKTELPTGETVISHKDNIILIGSCFADNIGNRLCSMKFRTDCNPFGVQYNPMSIASVLERVASGEPFKEDSPELFLHNSQWHSIMHHGSFSRKDKDELIRNINHALSHAHETAKKCDVAIITFGTAFVYSRKSDNRIVGNCHKLPERDFDRRMLDTDTIVEKFSHVISLYKSINKDIRFIFTVSPIRHMRDGAHGNQKSKGTLLLAIDEIIERNSNCFYFPAYEIMLDELRDYRFYADDMVHPSSMAVEYIWECFGKCYFNSNTTTLNSCIEEVARGLSHRPFDAESDGYRRFLKALTEKMETLTKKHPYLDFEKEITQCNTLLGR